MKAAVYYGQGDIRFQDITCPKPSDSELLVQVTGVGICGTDATEFARGPSMFPIQHTDPVTGHSGPMVPGHEFAGVVAATGPRTSGFAEGDLITSGAGISCGACKPCQAGRSNLCLRYSTVGLQRNGALAEFTTVPASACINLRNHSVAPDVAAMAQPMSIAVHAVSRGRVTAGEGVIVLGTGGIGAFVVYAATQAGAEVTAVDLDPGRLEIAAALGAANTVAAQRDVRLIDLIPHANPSVVLECTGAAAMIEGAIKLVAPGGRVVVVGLQKAPVPVDLLSLAIKEKELIGTLAHVFGSDFGQAVELLEAGREVWQLVAPSVLPLEDLVTSGLLPMVEGGPTPIKTLLDPRIDSPRPTVTS